MLPSLGSVALALAAVALPADAAQLVMPVWNSLVTARMDPVMSPGAVSGHSHHVVGGSGFSPTYSGKTQRQSKCTNLPVQADLSNYWIPQIFRITADGKYIGLQTGIRLYYFFDADTGVVPFPENFQLVVGDPNRKAKRPDNIADDINSYYCDRPESGVPSFGSLTLPMEPCHTLIMKIFTPPCWNGKPMDRANPEAHMSFPQGCWNCRDCPASHPIRLPGILIESFQWSENANPAFEGLTWPPAGQQQYILANGDTTGYGLHGDFQNGWSTRVLSGMLRKCTNPTRDDPIEEGCPFLKPFTNRTAQAECQFEGMRPDESVGWLNGKAVPLTKLPGCNMPWASGKKPACPATVGRIGLGLRWIQTVRNTIMP